MLKVLKKIPEKVFMTVTKPERFFKKIVLDGELEDSIIKAFLFGLLGGMAILMIGLIGGATITFSDVFMKLIAYPIIAVVILFIFAGLMMLFTEIAKGNRDWEMAVKGVSSIFFMYPVILIADSLAFSCWSLWIINILIDDYVLFLLYNITHFCMGGKKWRIISIMFLCAVFLAIIYTSDYRIGWLALKNASVAMSCLV